MSPIRTVGVAIAVLCLATPLIAQSITTRPDTTTASASLAPVAGVPSAGMLSTTGSDNASLVGVATPSWTRAVSAEPARTSSQTAATRAFDAGPTRENTAMMIVGGAGLLVSGIIGGTPGTAIAVGGGVVGLIGLWDYFK
jgi:hypothetical protein